MPDPAQTYRQFSVQGSTPLGLVVMLYDGAIAAMQRAITAIEDQDIQKKCTHLNRAQAIIAQLEGTLNFELGGQVAQTLKQFYVHARTRILEANIKNSKEILTSLVQQFSMVREAWEQADHLTPSTPDPPPGAKSEPGPPDASEASEARHLRLSA
jgi:flagellar protein FliS